MAGFQSQCFSVDREMEDLVLENVSFNQAIDETPSATPYDRLVMKLYTLGGLDADSIAELAGVSEEDISQTIRGLKNGVLETMRQTTMTLVPG